MSLATDKQIDRKYFDYENGKTNKKRIYSGPRRERVGFSSLRLAISNYFRTAVVVAFVYYLKFTRAHAGRRK